MAASIDEIRSDFAYLDDWEDRYRYLIDLGASLEPFPEQFRDAQHKVQGCVSQVWLTTEIGDGGDPRVDFSGDSDAHIVRGLVAVVLALFSGRKASDILAADAEALFRELGLDEHLTPQRANGLRSMVKRMRAEAELALSHAA